MTNTLSGIEQVRAEIHNPNRDKPITEEREELANLSIIDIHYNVGSMWEKLKLFIKLQPQFKEILFSCTLSD
jgi:hypothetical protein